jgi:beta-fructofuranosidase
MPYLPADHLMWDFWFAPPEPGEPLHVFYLRAPAAIGDPEDRHRQAEVGHATSRDLVTWENRGVALAPAPGPTWDDKAIWTGSIVNHDGTWYWFYTALTHADRQQRIGLATSDDLVTWTRHPENPLLSADLSWIESTDGDVAFRDPWVIPEPDGDGWLMYITTRVNHGPEDGRGVIALARSPNLIDWTLAGPVTAPGELGELEVPQYLKVGGQHYLLFCTGKHSVARLARPGTTPWIGTHYLTSGSAEGPWTLPDDPPMAADAAGTWYAGRVIEIDGRHLFFAWRRDRDGRFEGGLSNPAPLQVLSDGRLHVELAALDGHSSDGPARQ